jgi:hypothetical protein
MTCGPPERASSITLKKRPILEADIIGESAAVTRFYSTENMPGLRPSSPRAKVLAAAGAGESKLIRACSARTGAFRLTGLHEAATSFPLSQFPIAGRSVPR